MGQTLEMLLAADPSEVKNIPTGQIEIKRLSKLLGKPFIITYRAATIDEIKEIGDKATRDGKHSEAEEMKWTIYEMVTDPNFKDAELRKAYAVVRPVDIVSTILLGGEIITVYNAIMNLSGFDRTAGGVNVDELKN